MIRTLSAWEARRQFGKVLREVSRDGQRFVIESHGEPVAAVVPIWMFDNWEQDRQAFFDDMRATSVRANLSEDEATRIVDEAIARVRAEARSRSLG